MKLYSPEMLEQMRTKSKKEDGRRRCQRRECSVFNRQKENQRAKVSLRSGIRRKVGDSARVPESVSILFVSKNFDVFEPTAHSFGTFGIWNQKTAETGEGVGGGGGGVGQDSATVEAGTGAGSLEARCAGPLKEKLKTETMECIFRSY